MSQSSSEFAFQAVASKLHGVEVEMEVIRRKGDVIELTESEVSGATTTATTTTTTASRRLERAATMASKSNRPLGAEQVSEETTTTTTQGGPTRTGATWSTSKFEGNLINCPFNYWVEFILCVNR